MKAYVFDFDDTLAHTDGAIGVAHFEHGECKDPVEWLESIGLQRSHVMYVRKYPACNAAYIDTAGFREYTAIIRLGVNVQIREAGEGTGIGIEDVLDFSHVNDMRGATPITKVVDIARKAAASGHIIGVITGRRGSGNVMGLDSVNHPITTKQDIQGFLARNGVPVEMADIWGVGHLPGSVANNKASVMLRHFIEKYQPDEVIFYDDDDLNIRAVEALSDSYRITVHDTKTMSESFNPRITSLVERARERRLSRERWSTCRRLANVGYR